MSQINAAQSDPNGNHDSGYAPSNIEDVMAANATTPPASPHHHHQHHPGATIFVNRNVHYNKSSTKNGSTSAKNTTALAAVATPNASPKKEPTFR
jgi:hypothetical protein